MKKIYFVLIIILLGSSISAQKLMEIYKKGTIRLIPDTEYGKGNDWDKVFKTYYDTIYNKPMGSRKSLIMMPDGSVVINHAYRNYYSKFSASGKFEKEFGVKNSKGVQFKSINHIDGVINNQFFTGLDNMGNMVCFDFNGNYVKTLKLNYMTKQMIPLPNNKIAVVGWAIWKDKFRDFVALVDYNTNKEQVIWEHYTERTNNVVTYNKEFNLDTAKNKTVKRVIFVSPSERTIFNYSYSSKSRGSFTINTMPFSNGYGLNARPIIACVGDKLIVAFPHDGQIFVYDLNGKLIEKSKINWALNFLSVEEQKEIQQKAIDKFSKAEDPFFAKFITTEENKSAHESLIYQMKWDLNKIKDPIPIPAFSTILKDSDGNLLFFEFPKEEKANKFNVWVYNNGGKFICQSSFVCDDYELEINPGKMVFYKGYIYGLQLAKKASGVPLRLVRFKITN